MIILNSVIKWFGDTKAVDGVSLQVDRGEIFGLIGPDGAGKTTLMRILLGLEAPTSGSFSLFGNTKTENQKDGTGYVAQKFSLYTDLTVFENLRCMGGLYGLQGAECTQRAGEVLRFTHLWEFRDRLAGALSGGMKQKLALAAGMLHKPQLLFLDEPTTGVDPASRREFWQLLYRLNQEGTTIFISTPYMDEAEFCTRIGFMNAGKIIACNTPSKLRKKYPYAVLEVTAGGRNTKRFLLQCSAKEVNAFGNTYHIVTTHVEKTKQEIEKILLQAGVEAVQIEQISPTLEDVFVDLIRDEEL